MAAGELGVRSGPLAPAPVSCLPWFFNVRNLGIPLQLVRPGLQGPGLSIPLGFYTAMWGLIRKQKSTVTKFAL